MQDSPLLAAGTDLPVQGKAGSRAVAAVDGPLSDKQNGLRLSRKGDGSHGVKASMHKMRAPLEMAALLVLGIAGAVAHQIYYYSLHRRSVSLVNVSQEWNIRIGTGLAFLAKTGWTIAVLIAQSQQVWTTMDRKALNVDIADAMILAPTNFLKFRHLSLIRQAKTATFLALLVWCIPLSAIFTPATLTVVSVSQPNPRTLRSSVPMVNFANATNFAALATCSPDLCHLKAPSSISGAMQFRYPSAQTVLLAVAGSSSAQIQPMIPQYPNSSYTTPFFGPAIQCENANSSTAQKINNMYSATVPPYSDSQGRPYTSYYGFVPGRSQNGTLTSVDLAHLPDTYSEINNAKIPSAPEIWIRTHVSEPPDGDITLAYGLKEYACVLQNASYTVAFSYHRGV